MTRKRGIIKMKTFDEISVHDSNTVAQEDGYLPVVNRSISICIPLMEILYIQRDSRTITVITGNGEYRYYEKMDNVLRFLNGHFYQSLQGLVVNLHSIREMRDQCIRFSNGRTIKISYKAYCRTRQVYSNYILNGRKCFVLERETDRPK